MGSVDRVFENENVSEVYAKFRPPYNDAVFQIIYDYCDEKPTDDKDKLAIDVACGTGLSTLPLANKFEKVIGIDVSVSQLNCARQVSASERVNYIEASADNLPIASNSASLVTVATGLHWIEEDEKGYQEMDRVLVPGGVIAVYQYGPYPRILQHPRSRALSAILSDIIDLAWNNSPFERTRSAYTSRLSHPRMLLPYTECRRIDPIPGPIKTNLAGFLGFILTSSSMIRNLMEEGTVEQISKYKQLRLKFLETFGGDESSEVNYSFDVCMIIGRKPAP